MRGQRGGFGMLPGVYVASKEVISGCLRSGSLFPQTSTLRILTFYLSSQFSWEIFRWSDVMSVLSLKCRNR